MDIHASMYAVGDTAWTRVRIFYYFHEFTKLLIDSNQNTMLNTINMGFIILRVDNNTPMLALGYTAWTRGQIFT